MKFLFGTKESLDSSWVVQRFFDEAYDYTDFVWVVALVASRTGYINDDISCRFPDSTSFDEEDHFDGVEFGVDRPSVGPRKVVVTDAECRKWLQEACNRYVRLHPEQADAVDTAINTPSIPEGPVP